MHICWRILPLHFWGVLHLLCHTDGIDCRPDWEKQQRYVGKQHQHKKVNRKVTKQCFFPAQFPALRPETCSSAKLRSQASTIITSTGFVLSMVTVQLWPLLALSSHLLCWKQEKCQNHQASHCLCQVQADSIVSAANQRTFQFSRDGFKYTVFAHSTSTGSCSFSPGKRWWGELTTADMFGQQVQRNDILPILKFFLHRLNSALFFVTCCLYPACFHSCFLQQATLQIPCNSEVSTQVEFGQEKWKKKKSAVHSALMIQIWEQILQKTMT